MPLVLGIRSSLHVTVADVRDADTGSLVATGRSDHPLPRGEEHDPSLWWNGLVAAIADAGATDVAAMAVASDTGGLLVLDAAGSVLHPALTWASGVARGDAAELVRRLGAGRWARATGGVPTAGSTVAQLAWLKRTRPGAFARIGSVLLPHDWLTYRLTGRLVTDRGQASTTGYWSPRDERWMTAALGVIDDAWSPDDWVERLPQILGPDDRADWLAAPTYELLGLRGRPLVAPGTGIPMAQALAVGLTSGRPGVMVGATATIAVPTGSPVRDDGGVVRSFAGADGRHLPTVLGGCGLGALRAIAALRGASPGALAAEAVDAPLGADGVHVSATPGAKPITSMTGLDGTASDAVLARAALEGIACEALDAVDALVAAGVSLGDDPPVVSTSADVVDAMAQVLADCAGRSVAVVEPTGDMAALGAAVQAAAVLHERTPAAIATAWGLGPTHDVAPVTVVGGEALRERHRRVRQALREREIA